MKYVISHTGKPGGPWEAKGQLTWGGSTHSLANAAKWTDKARADAACKVVRQCKEAKPDAKVLRLVPSSRRALRDAVVGAALKRQDALDAPDLKFGNEWVRELSKANDALDAATRALREHEKT